MKYKIKVLHMYSIELTRYYVLIESQNFSLKFIIFLIYDKFQMLYKMQ